ncbi:MAG: recombinase family protein [Bacteroidales bacterium]|nr:recombinase family protein [Bacteroidales bacterium]
MNVGYVRVSTIEQNETRQFTVMEQYNVEKIFHEKISGKNVERPTLKEMIQFVRKGDTLIIESYSRLARSTKDLLNIFEELNSKGAKL